MEGDGLAELEIVLPDFSMQDPPVTSIMHDWYSPYPVSASGTSSHMRKERDCFFVAFVRYILHGGGCKRPPEAAKTGLLRITA